MKLYSLKPRSINADGKDELRIHGLLPNGRAFVVKGIEPPPVALLIQEPWEPDRTFSALSLYAIKYEGLGQEGALTAERLPLRKYKEGGMRQQLHVYVVREVPAPQENA